MNPGDPVYDMAFNLFAMEEEGLIPTRRGILNAFCNYFNEHREFNILNDTDWIYVADLVGIDWDLTKEDLEYISSRLIG